MTCTKIPKSINCHMNQIVRIFLWAGDVKTKKMSLVKWDNITLPKNLGVLGSRDFNLINLTMLEKMA